MNFSRKIGIWLIGALGGVGSTVALGLAALQRHRCSPVGLVTELPLFNGIDLDPPSSFVLGGHDIRQAHFVSVLQELQLRSGIFSHDLIHSCSDQLQSWTENIRPGTALGSGKTIQEMLNWHAASKPRSPREWMSLIQADIDAFQRQHRLDQVIVVNVASTEPPAILNDAQHNWESWQAQLGAVCEQPSLPASSIYALAVIERGWPYINFTPSLGASFPAALELANTKQVPLAGQDGKTGETLLKSVLAPMFAHRHLKILSWVGHNIFGNRDGMVLNDPANKASKIRTKDQIISAIAGYQPQTHVSIEYIESLDDWKTAWDHIHFQGFLGVKMTMQFTWQGCDSILAAPLVIDLVRLMALVQRRGEYGIQPSLACFFKNPMGVQEHDFYRQFQMLEAYIQKVRSA